MPHFKSSDGLTLFYKDCGSGPTVVFVHGNNTDSQFWSYQLAVLSEHGVRAVAPDRRGHGRSDYTMNGHDYDTYAADVAALLEVANLRDVTLIGHSTGANTIVRYIGRYNAARVAGVVLLSMVSPAPVPRDDVAATEATQQIIDATVNDRPKFFDSLKDAFFGRGVPEVTMNAFLAQAYNVPLEVAVQTVRLLLDPRNDTRNDLAAFTIPTLIVHGDADSFSPFEVSGACANQLIPNNRVLLYEGASLGFALAEPGRFTSDLLTFVASTSALTQPSLVS